MTSSFTSSLGMISRMKKWVGFPNHSEVSESIDSTLGLERATELLIPEDVRGRVVSYDVFISHRGSDAKKEAADIHEEMKRLGVNSFFDTDGIFKGENLSGVIVEAINSSTVLLVIFSKGFAESAWCLEEVKLMVEKMKMTGNEAVLIPVFFGVEPEDLKDVRRGLFSMAFKKHKKDKEFSSVDIKKWEEILQEVSSIPGPRLSDFNGRKDNLFKTVVQVVVKRVRNVEMEIAKYPVAVIEKVQELDDLVDYAKSVEDTPCILGIVGMAGIGKTAVAKGYFNASRSSFTAVCFVDGVKEKVKSSGLVSIQKMLLKELLLLDVEVRNVNEGIKLLKKRLQGVKVLLVLDDVSDSTQLEALIVNDVLSPGSVVLVTTTDSGLLREFDNVWYYEVKKLDKCQSKELLLMHSMKKKESTYPELETCIEEYLELCDGLPLSLELVGRLLAGVTNKFHWKNTLSKVSDILPMELRRKFESFFENLNQVEKEVALDIACLFHDEDCDLALSFWDASGIQGEKVSNELVSKHAVDYNLNKFSIHPQLKLYITQALDEVNRTDRRNITHLWRPRDVQKALVQNLGFSNLEYLSLVVKGSERSSLPDVNGVRRSDITWKEYEDDTLGPWPTECFSKMSKLKLLMLEDACVVGELSGLPKSIIWLRWRFYPHNCLPLELPISKLWVLQLEGGKLSSLWVSDELTEIPLQLRHLHLQGCVNLGSLPASIGVLNYLEVLDLKGCKALTFLPDEICNAQSMTYLDLSGCSSLEYLPLNIGNLKNLFFLGLNGCLKLVSLPNSFSELVNLISLDLRGCKNLTRIPYSSKTLSELQNLYLSGCGILEAQLSLVAEEAPDLLNAIVEANNLRTLELSINGYTNLLGNYGQLSLLTSLYIEGPDLLELPWSLGDLSSLTHFTLTSCFALKNLVRSVAKLKGLKDLKIYHCGLVELPEEIGQLCNLEILCIHYCKKLTELPSSLTDLSALLQLELVGNPSLSVSHERFSSLSLLRNLVLDGCNVSDECLSMISEYCASLTCLKLQDLPISEIKIAEGVFPNLGSLSIVSCNSLFAVEVFPKLHVLEVVRCLRLQLVSIPTGMVMWLRELRLNHCPELSLVQCIEMLQNLKKIDTVGCTNLHYIQGLELVRSLQEMHIFITYWGFCYHGDEWLQKLQMYIYAPAMHFVTKTVLNKDDLFENFHKMDKVSSVSLTFQLPESTVSCAWVMVAFLSRDIYQDYADIFRILNEMKTNNNPDAETYSLPQLEKHINVTLCDDTRPISNIHEYRAVEVGESIHFSIFTGDFWLCEQLKSGRTINISSESSYEELQSGWVRILSVEEESNIEAIQSEFFEKLRKEKKRSLSIVEETEAYYLSKILELRREASSKPPEVTEMSQEQVRDTFDLKIGTWSVKDMKDFQALDIANCRIVRAQSLKSLTIQAEYLAPTYEREQTLFLQDYRENLSPLHLEISKACWSVVNNVVPYSQATSVQVTIAEDFDNFPGLIVHNYDHFFKTHEQEAIQENSPIVLQVVMDHCNDMEHLEQIEEENLLRNDMHQHIQFFADDENGVGIFIPDLSDTDDSYDDDDSDE